MKKTDAELIELYTKGTVADVTDHLRRFGDYKQDEVARTIDQEGNSALHIATKANNVNVVKHLYLLYPKIVKNNDGETPLHTACKSGLSTITQIHLMHLPPDDRELTDEYGNNILHLAISRGDLQTIRYAIFADPSQTLINTKNKDGITPFDLASKDDELKQFVLKQLDILKAKNKTLAKSTLHFHKAILYNSAFKLNNAMESYSVDCFDNDGDAPIHLAAQMGNIVMVDKLLTKTSSFQKIANINEPNIKNGKTPLDYAVDTDNKDMINFLVSKGAKQAEIITAPSFAVPFKPSSSTSITPPALPNPTIPTDDSAKKTYSSSKVKQPKFTDKIPSKSKKKDKASTWTENVTSEDSTLYTFIVSEVTFDKDMANLLCRNGKLMRDPVMYKGKTYDRADVPIKEGEDRSTLRSDNTAKGFVDILLKKYEQSKSSEKGL